MSAARQSRNEAGTTDRKIAGQKNGMPVYLSVPYFSVSRSSIRFPRSLRTISTIAVQRGQCRNRTARSVWSARSLLPLSNHPCLTTAPASWTHSKRFARQFIRRCLPPVPRSARSWFGRCFPRPGGTRSRSKPPRQRAIGPRTRRNDPPADGQHPAGNRVTNAPEGTGEAVLRVTCAGDYALPAARLLSGPGHKSGDVS
jgi:hypothetical protein